MQKAYKLEDAGHLGAAADAYLRVLTCPDQVGLGQGCGAMGWGTSFHNPKSDLWMV
jgi:hypothetical protein